MEILLEFIFKHRDTLLEQPLTLLVLLGVLWWLNTRLVYNTQKIIAKYKEARRKLIRETADKVRGVSMPYLNEELSKRILLVFQEYEPKLMDSDVPCPKESVAQCFSFPYYKYKKEYLIGQLRIDHTEIINAIENSLIEMFHELNELVIENGYHGKTDADLDVWVNIKGSIIFTNSIERIGRMIGQDNLFTNTTGFRYTENDAKKHLKELVNGVVNLDKLEKKSLRNIRKLIWKKYI